MFLFAPGWNEGGAGHEEQNSGGVVRQARIYPVRNTPLLNNKPLRLFLKTGRCHTKYATHIDLLACSTSSFGRAFVIFIVQSMAPPPSFVHVWGPDAHVRCRAKRKALRTKVQRALKGGYLRGQILFGILYLDFNLDAAGKFELHQCVDRLGVRAVDVDETLVGRNFELLAALLVDEGRTVDGENALARGEGDGTAHDGAGGFHVGNNLFCRFLNERVVIALEFDADLLTHLLFELNFALRQWDKSRSLSHCADKIGILLRESCGSCLDYFTRSTRPLISSSTDLAMLLETGAW